MLSYHFGELGIKYYHKDELISVYLFIHILKQITMDDNESLKNVFTGSVLEADYIKSLLEENGIGAMVRNTMGESLVAGWVSGGQDDAGLVYVIESHELEAKRIIAEYLNIK